MLTFFNSQTLYEGMLDLSHMKPIGNAWLATMLDGKEINRRLQS